MAAELITPVDELTGIPLPILPQDYLDRNDPNVNWHHAWHADSAPELQGLGGRALRHSRVQLVRAVDHNYKDNGRPNYHNFYVGPELPTSDDEKFRLCVISAAGFVPDEAIDLRKGEPAVVRMTDKELALIRTAAGARLVRNDEITRVKKKAVRDYRSLRQSGARRKYVNSAVKNFRKKREAQAEYGFHHLTYQYGPIRDFFQQYVLLQEVEDITESHIEEFLRTPDVDIKENLGRKILKLTVNQIVDPVEGPYQQLRRQGKLHPKMPMQAKSLVFYKLGSSEERAQLAHRKASLLGRQLGIIA